MGGIIDLGGVGMKKRPWIKAVSWTKVSGEIKGLLGCVREWLAARWRKARMNDYYYSGGETQKDFRARSIDRLFSRGVVFFLTASLVYFLVQNFLISVITGAMWTIMFHVLAKSRRNKRIVGNRERMLEKEAVDRFLRMTEDKDPGEFFYMVRGLLDKSELFAELELIKDDEDRPLLMTGYFKGEKAGVYARKLKPESMVKEKDLKEFVQYCESRGLENGIYIANGAFDYASRDYAAGLDTFDLFIADTRALYRGFLKRDFLFPMKDLEAKIEQTVLEQSRETQHRLRKILAFRRIRTYAVLSILIAVYSVMVPYTLYYILVSSILLCLSVTALVRWEIEKFREETENSIKLDSVMDTD